jgi:hypothetical protein
MASVTSNESVGVSPSFPVGPYEEVQRSWPRHGHAVLATHTDDTVVLYQAYNDRIADYAVKHGVLGGPDFSLTRMSWAKPNFLWMMYRSGWGTKPNQTRTLALHISKEKFFHILSLAHVNAHMDGHTLQSSDPTRRASLADEAAVAVESRVHSLGPAEAAHKGRARSSPVVVQWDPDHGPSGGPMLRRAVQIGMRGETLQRFASEWLLHVEDISEFVRQQRPHAQHAPYEGLMVPCESLVQLPPDVARHAHADQ